MKKGFIIVGSFLLVCLIVLAIVFGDGNTKKENPQEPIKEESDTGLEVIDPEQMEEEEEEKVFIVPDGNKTDANATENKNSTSKDGVDKKDENNKKDETSQGGDNSDKNENNTENNENSKPSKGDLDENEEDDGKTQMGDFF